MDMLKDENETIEYAYATFKTTRIINSHTIENPAPGVLLFMIQHRFGRINTGYMSCLVWTRPVSVLDLSMG